MTICKDSRVRNNNLMKCALMAAADQSLVTTTERALLVTRQHIQMYQESHRR